MQLYIFFFLEEIVCSQLSKNHLFFFWSDIFGLLKPPILFLFNNNELTITLVENFSPLAIKFTAAADLVIQLLLMFGVKSQLIVKFCC